MRAYSTQRFHFPSNALVNWRGIVNGPCGTNWIKWGGEVMGHDWCGKCRPPPRDLSG